MEISDRQSFLVARLQKHGLFSLVSEGRPSVSAGEILVEIAGCSICGSDLRTIKAGNARVTEGRIIGHEVAGTIIEIGAYVDAAYQLGDFVCLGADYPCLNCIYCEDDRFEECKAHLAIGHQVDGGFAKYLVLPEEFVRQGPMVVSERLRGKKEATLAEPLACVLKSINKAGLKTQVGCRILVYGGGSIGTIMGLTFATHLRSNVDQINFIDPSKARRHRLDSISKQFRVYATEADFLDDNDCLATHVFVACSVAEAQQSALNTAAKNAVVCFFGGMVYSEREVPLDVNKIHYQELLIFGTSGSSKSELIEAVSVLENFGEEFAKVITSTFRVEDINSAFSRASSGEELKVVMIGDMELV